MIKFVDLYGQYLGIRDDIDAAIQRVIRDSAYIGGPALAEFEQDFAACQQAGYCIGVANGTDAIEIGLEALGLPAGSEVLVPANSFIASSEAVTRAGHRVVFADVDPHTYLLDLAELERRITPRTKAIIAVHLYGNPCDLEGMSTIARRHGLKLLEDSAQAHGAEWNGKRIGALGDLGTFSFYPGKNLGAYGDGGAIVTNDAALARRCRMIANHGRVEKYNHEFEGRCSRLDGLQAAILGVKLKHLERWIDRRNAVARAYLSGLASIPGLVLPNLRPDTRHAFHLFVVSCERRDELKAHLETRGIQTGVHYPIALPRLSAYAYLGQAETCPVASRLAGEVLSLPMGEHLTDSDVVTVIAAVREFFQSPGPASSGTATSSSRNKR